MATWNNVCAQCQLGKHGECNSPNNNPCDCANNGHSVTKQPEQSGHIGKHRKKGK